MILEISKTNLYEKIGRANSTQYAVAQPELSVSLNTDLIVEIVSPVGFALQADEKGDGELQIDIHQIKYLLNGRIVNYFISDAGFEDLGFTDSNIEVPA